jgi:hypothetical protein
MNENSTVRQSLSIPHHVFYTWLLSCLLYPVGLAFVLMIEGQPYHFLLYLQTGMWLMFTWGLLISVPLLSLAILSLKFIARLPYAAGLRFVLWTAVFSCLMLIGAYGSAGICAALLAVFFRQPQFQQLIAQHEIN